MLAVYVLNQAGVDLGSLVSSHGGDLTAWGIVGIVVLLVLTGRLVSGRELKEARRERDAWQRVALRAMGQSDQLLVSSEVTNGVMKALKDQVKAPAEESP